MVVCMPHACRVRSRINRFVALSSTTSTGMSARWAAGRRGGRPLPAARSNGHVNQNLLPRAHLALHPDLAAHQLDELLGDGQAQPAASIGARRRRVGLGEAVEDVRSRLAGDTDAGIADRRRRSSTTASERSPFDSNHHLAASVNLTALPTRFTRIWRSRPPSPRRTSGMSGAIADGQLEALLVRLFCRDLDRHVDHGAEVEIGDLQPHATRLDLGDVQDVVDHV